MIYLLGTFFFILGAIIGSFLNVVINRHNTGKGIMGRSFCAICDRTLKWFELVPVLSFLAIKARCRTCETKISHQYIVVELFTGALFLLLYLNLADVFVFDPITASIQYLFYGIVVSLLVVILVYDIKHTIIPDLFSYSFAAIALAYLIIVNPNMLDFLAGPLLFLPFWALWYFSKGTWMGLGDGKLALGIGWFLGLTAGISAIMIAFWVGAIVSVALLLITRLAERHKGFTMKSEIPFAPFLIFGVLMTFFMNIDLFNLLLL